MNKDEQLTTAESQRRFLIGTICGMLAALGYSAANICLRAVSDVDPLWVACIKAVPTTMVMGPMLAWQHAQGRAHYPNVRVLALLIIGAVIGQAGNVLYQVALAGIGLALATPLMMGCLILTGAILGVLFLRERVTWSSGLAMLLVIVAILILSFEATDKAETVSSEISDVIAESSWLKVAGGLAAACGCGACFGALGIFIRYGVSGRTSIAFTTLTISVVGIVLLSAMSIQRQGIGPLFATDASDFRMMVLAGVFNALAFFAVSKGLQLTSVVYINTINGSQSAICAIAGVLLFSERFSIGVMIGVALTIIALWVMQQRTRPDDLNAKSKAT